MAQLARPALLALVVTTGAACGPRGTHATDELPPECAALNGQTATGAIPALRPEQPRGVLVTGATVMTAAGETFAPGYVVFEDGRITEVGGGDGPVERDDLDRVDASGRFVTPGVIDTHSHLGVYATPGVAAHSDGNEATSPTTPEVEAVDSVWPQDPGFERALAGGVTSLQILPGSANLIGGRGFTMKLHRGALHAEQLRFPGAPETLKMACGENPKRVYGGRGQMPSTRMGSIAVVRQTWTDAERYREERDEYLEALGAWCDAGAPESSRPEEPAVDLAQETLAGVLRGDILPQVHCYRADEMLAQLDLAAEFGFVIRSFHHAVEAYKIADVLATYPVAVSTWADWWGFKIEAWDSIPENAALVHAAGGVAVIHSDSDIGIQRLNQEAAKAFAAGVEAGIDLDQEDALRWFTANPAWALGIEDQTGTLEVGKMADIVVWSAHPLSVYAQADLVFVDGVLEYDRAAPRVPWSDFELGLWPHLSGAVP
jgi:imidazolonepropionase-like amidohydrolase